MRFGTKYVEIEAVQWLGNEVSRAEIESLMDREVARVGDKQLAIHTLEGTMLADVGDWIIKGLIGEFYPCKPQVFERKYELVTPGSHKT